MPGEKDVAILWDDEVEWEDDTPFQIKNLDEDYAFYTEIGQEHDIDFYIARFNWYEKEALEKAWRWDGEEWRKVHSIELDGVFDKYRYNEDTKDLKKRIAENLPVLNDPELEELCKDKLKTYELFSDYVPETREATEENLEEMLETYEMVVFKPRFGASGVGVEFIEDKTDFEEPDNPEQFILQRFIGSDGFPGIEEVTGPHDLRTHVIDGKLQENNYVRVPAEGLQSNISQGGNQIYVKNNQIPEEALEIVEEIRKKLEKFSPSVFSVDIMFDRENRPWLVELNSKPAIYYSMPHKDKKKELPRMKKLVETIKKTVEE